MSRFIYINFDVSRVKRHPDTQSIKRVGRNAKDSCPTNLDRPIQTIRRGRVSRPVKDGYRIKCGMTEKRQAFMAAGSSLA